MYSFMYSVRLNVPLGARFFGFGNEAGDSFLATGFADGGNFGKAASVGADGGFFPAGFADEDDAVFGHIGPQCRSPQILHLVASILLV